MMRENEINTLCDNSLLYLYRTISMLSSLIEEMEPKLNSTISASRLDQRATPSSGPDFFKKSKGLLEYRKQSLELKLLLLKLTETIQARNLPESDDFEVKSKELNLINEFTKEFFFSETNDTVNIPKFENLANFNRAKKNTFIKFSV